MLLKFRDHAEIVCFIDSQKKYVMIRESGMTEFAITTKKGRKYESDLADYITIHIFPTHIRGVYKCEELPGYQLLIRKDGMSGELVCPSPKQYEAEKRRYERQIIERAQQLLREGMKFSQVKKWAYEQRACFGA